MYLIYSMPNCVYCLKAKNLLTIKGIAYREQEIADAEKRREFLTALKNGWRSYPVIFALDSAGRPTRFVGGYDNLVKDLETGLEA